MKGKSSSRVFVKFIFGFIIAFLFICILLIIIPSIIVYIKIDDYVFMPNVPSNSRELIESPNKYNLTYEEIYFATSDAIELHSFFIKSKHVKDVPTVLYCHGNGGNIGHRLGVIETLQKAYDCNVFIFDYRGYGKSGGVPSEMGLYLDAEAAMQYLLTREDINKERILLYGHSLGGAIAIHTAAKHQKHLIALIVTNTFTTLADVVSDRSWFTSLIPNDAFKYKFRNIDLIEHIQLPVLFISSRKDTLVSSTQMDKLYKTNNNAGVAFKRLLMITNANHNQVWLRVGYVEAIRRFLDEVLSYHELLADVPKADIWTID